MYNKEQVAFEIINGNKWIFVMQGGFYSSEDF